MSLQSLFTKIAALFTPEASTTPPWPASLELSPESPRDIAAVSGRTLADPCADERFAPKFQANKEKGDAFERFVVSRFNCESNRKYFRLKHWRSDKGVPGFYAESNCDPDLELEFCLRGEKTLFAVECKWRQSPSRGGTVTWANQEQPDNYRAYAARERRPVFVVLGLGGKPDAPGSVYIIPLERLTGCRVSLKWLDCFEREDADRAFFFDAQKKRLS